MKHTIASLIGFKMSANDGEIGEVKEFYFDDETWAIRYLVVETGNWFFNKKVLIDPQAILETDLENKIFQINLSKAQIENSPDIDTDKPISHRQEIEMYGHYAWNRYGGSGFYAGASPRPMDSQPIIDEKIIAKNDSDADQADPHLRSTASVSGYHIHATDGDIGHIKDFILDVKNWIITDLLIDSSNWFGGKKVLLATRHVKTIIWSDFKINLDISKAFIKDEHSFDPESLNE